MIKSILCATDGSNASQKAAGYAIDLAHQLNAQLTFLTVEPFKPGEVEYPIYRLTTMVNETELQIHKDLDHAMQLARQAGLTDVNYALAASRHVPDAITKYATDNGFDLIITGHVGRSNIISRAIGSVAAAVMEKAHCPVLIVR